MKSSKSTNEIPTPSRDNGVAVKGATNSTWNDSTQVKFKEYNGQEDPYNPLPRTKKLQQAIRKYDTLLDDSKNLATSKSLSFLSSSNGGIGTGTIQYSMKQMDRIEEPPDIKFPASVSKNDSFGSLGMTYSNESANSVAESQAELEVLKAVLNREGYLNRLYKVVKTIEKKFTTDIADLLDFIRVATIDVIEAVLKWREAKNDHDAAFMWNGNNYLLKITSDLDYLQGYYAIIKWIGYSLERNPFCVPMPMNEGKGMVADSLLDPKHVEEGLPSDGFILGGLTHKKMIKQYAASKSTDSSPVKQQPKSTMKSAGGGEKPSDISQSFILNRDMLRIRQAELVILKEEEKFGPVSRDPEGNIVPLIQAKTRFASVQLRRDDHKPISEPSSLATYAPHAFKSDIGIAPITYLPEKLPTDYFLQSDLVAPNDETVIAKQRGKVMKGGILSDLESKGVETRPRRALPTTLGASIEFSRNRKKKSLGERLAEIGHLKDVIMQEKKALERLIKKERGLISSGSDRGGVDTRGSNISRPLTSTSKGENQRKNAVMSSDDDHDVNGKDAADIRIEVIEEGVVEGKEYVLADAVDITSRIDANIHEAKQLEIQHRLTKLSEEEVSHHNTIHHLDETQDVINALKTQEHGKVSAERSREIERKRRLLTSEESKRTGVPPEDPPNVYDYYSTRVQACIRGWLARCWMKWYRRASRKAAIVIQSGIRGCLVRWRVWMFKLRYRAAQQVQKIFRGWRARGQISKVTKNRNIGKAARRIQTCYRGWKGRLRFNQKVKLDKLAKEAMQAVDVRTIFASDAKELARRIQYAIDEPGTTSFPPDEVLHLIRLAVMIFQGSRGLLGFAQYDFLNNRHYTELDGEFLTWDEAAKMVNRSERFVRQLRFIAIGPCSKPPRLLQIPQNVYLLLDAMKGNPKWSMSTFELMGVGSKIATHMFLWTTAILEVAYLQRYFLRYIASSFPDWLPVLMDLQARSRNYDFQLNIHYRTIECITNYIDSNPDDDTLNKMLLLESKRLAVTVSEIEKQRDEVYQLEEKLGEDQTLREQVALAQMNNNLVASVDELTVIAKRYKRLSEKATEGDRFAEEELPGARAELTDKEMSVGEYRSQFEFLQIQIDDNVSVRKNFGRLTPQFKSKAYVIGESKGKLLIAQAKCQTFLKDAGVKYEDTLTDLQQIAVYNELKETQKVCYDESKSLMKNGEVDRLAYDDSLYAAMKESERKSHNQSSVSKPSEAEMEEERYEDESQALQEKLKSSQYVPESIKLAPTRPRPVIIALARDLPGFIKHKIVAEVTRLCPGVFVHIDIDDNMGLNSERMQCVLDSHHNIIMSVDHGLTDMTRKNFLKNLNMTVKALIPVPFLAFAVGNESNLASSAGLSMYGVSKRDLVLSRDKDIKGSIELMAYVPHEMQKPYITARIVEMSADVVPSSPSLVHVLEALYVVLSDSDNFYSPDTNAAFGGSTWRLTQRLLADPATLIKQLKSYVRGKGTTRKCDCIHRYIDHRHWPVDELRLDDPALNLLALYVEKWYLSESTTIRFGGVPAALTKNLSLGIQTVISVADNLVDADADYFCDNTNAGWRMPSAKLIRVALQDLRIHKAIIKIDNAKYQISVYREGKEVFFDAYDPITSQVFISSIQMKDVPSLLIPDAFSINAGAKDEPPLSQQELAIRLSKLLTFETVKGQRDARKVLLCKRDYRFLQNITTKISGHRVHVKCYEAALGQLYFKAYFHDLSAYSPFLFDENARLAMVKYHDPDIEGSCAVERDAKLFLPQVIDRLRITPSNRFFQMIGFRYNANEYHKIKRDTVSLIKSQGLRVTVRARGGAGKYICQRIQLFHYVPHVVQVRSSSANGKVLIIAIYEPRTQHQMEVRLNQFQRRLLLGYDHDDHYVWYKQLVHRLRLNWRGAHSIAFDYTILKVIRKIVGRRMIVHFDAVDENNIRISLTETSTSIKYTTLLSKETVIRLIVHMPDADVIKRDFGLADATDSVRSILIRSMETSKLVKKTKKSGGKKRSAKTEEEHLDIAIFDTPMYDIISDSDCLTDIANKLQVLLKCDADAVGDDGTVLKYYSIEPAAATMTLDIERHPTNRLDIDTQLAYKPRLEQFTVDRISVDGVVSARRQVVPLNMEYELNELAHRKATEDFNAVESVIEEATVQVDQYLNTAFDNDDDRDEAITKASEIATTDLMDTLEQTIVNRMVERANPGTTQEVQRMALMMSGDGKSTVEVDETLLTEEQRDILGRGEYMIKECGVKVSFRKASERWSGHVSIKVYESLCWMPGGEGGVGRRLRFVVFDPTTSCYYEGIIRNSRHLREVLGVHGDDLNNPNMAVEMVLFIAKYRMNMVSNTTTWDGVDNDDGALYRVEFDSVRIYDNTKVTPINANGDDDAAANSLKVIDVDKMRGKKVLRYVRRVSGLLMQLTVFEVPEAKPAIAAAASQASTIEETDEADDEIEGNKTVKAYNDIMDSKLFSSGGAVEVSQDVGFSKSVKVARFKTFTLRVLAYDPKSKKKAELIATPDILLELAGGIYSPFLDPAKRRDLAKVLCEALLLHFPRDGKGFVLNVAWSGAKMLSNAVVDNTKKGNSWRSSADRVVKRPGKLFRSAMRIGKLDVVVTLYMQETAENLLEGENVAITADKRIIFNFYSTGASEAAEVLVDESDQIKRVGKTILSSPEGPQRSTLIRRFCRFFQLALMEDPNDIAKKVLFVDFATTKKGFVNEYKEIGVPPPGDDIRPVGIPSVFTPLSTCGNVVHRRVMSITNYENKNNLYTKDYVVSVYTKSTSEEVERGLVVKMYEQGKSETAILHLGPSELMRLCNNAEQPDILRDLVVNKDLLDAEHLDSMEVNFQAFTTKGEIERERLKMVNLLIDIVLAQLGVRTDPQLTLLPCIMSHVNVIQ